MTNSMSAGNPNLIVGCGYLGRQVASRWIQSGRQVIATTRGRVDELRTLGVEPIVADVRDINAIPGLPSVDTVLYAVGFDRLAGASMRSVYVDGLTNLLTKLPRFGKFIYVSSTGVYGDANGGWVDESTPPDPQDESGRVVREAELVLAELRPEAVILRFAGIYGPGRLMRESAIRAGESIAVDTEKWLNLIHVVDGVNAIQAAQQRAAAGCVYNVADGHPVKRGEFYRRLSQELGVPMPRFIPPVTAERGDRRIDNARMRNELGVVLQYPSYLEGLADSAAR